jgi:hypothetical protein
MTPAGGITPPRRIAVLPRLLHVRQPLLQFRVTQHQPSTTAKNQRRKDQNAESCQQRIEQKCLLRTENRPNSQSGALRNNDHERAKTIICDASQNDG